MISKNSRQAWLPNELGNANQICDLNQSDLVAVFAFLCLLLFEPISGKTATFGKAYLSFKAGVLLGFLGIKGRKREVDTGKGNITEDEIEVWSDGYFHFKE